MNVWDLRLAAAGRAELRVPEGHALALVVLRGTVQVNDEEVVREAQMVLLDRAGTEAVIEANGEAMVLLLSGEPIEEPVVGYGPFVMNTEAEIRQAIDDFNSGRFAPQAA
jgi:redox-sensitive bicupin YhaK (pirin superfamily)